MFWNKKENVDETLLERVEKLESKVRKLESESLDVLSSVEDMRNKVLRKLQSRRDKEKEEEEEETFKGIPTKW